MSSRRRGGGGVLGAALGVLSLAGCAGDECDGATADALYVTVVDAASGDYVDAVLAVTHDGASVSAECVQRHATASPCELWAMGYQQSGAFDVAIAAAGYVEGHETVDVAWGSCGPVSEMRRVELVRTPPP